MLYAIIETGGKQQKAVPGEHLKIEKLDAQVGDTVQFDKVMLISRDGSVELGKPYLDGVKVTATVTEQGRDKKILVFKMKRRKRVSTHARTSTSFHGCPRRVD